MNEQDARFAFGLFLARKEIDLGEGLAVTTASPLRLSRGWAFTYQARKYLETGKLSDMLVGQGPVVICDSGEIIEGTSLDLDPEALLPR